MHIPAANVSGSASRSEQTAPSSTPPITRRAAPSIGADTVDRAADVGSPSKPGAAGSDPAQIKRGNLGAAAVEGEPAGPVAAWPSSPLTADRLKDMPGYSLCVPPRGKNNLDGRFAYSTIGSLQFTGHPTIASLESRIDFINRVAQALCAMPAGKPVTIISIGSGQLLMEHLIHLQLPEGRQAAVHWRCIDPKYGKNMALEARRQFRAGKDARMFSTTGAYLLKEDPGARRPADLDKSGSVMVLAIDPPTLVPGSGPEPSLSMRGITPIGQAVDAGDVKKANAVLIQFELKTPDGTARLRNFASEVSARHLTLTTCVKCWPGNDGTLRFEFGQEMEPFRPIIESEIASAMNGMTGNRLPIEKLHAGASGFVSALNAQPQMKQQAVCVPFSDYTLSVEQVTRHFADAQGPVMLARLESNAISLTRIQDPA